MKSRISRWDPTSIVDPLLTPPPSRGSWKAITVAPAVPFFAEERSSLLAFPCAGAEAGAGGRSSVVFKDANTNQFKFSLHEPQRTSQRERKELTLFTPFTPLLLIIILEVLHPHLPDWFLRL